MREPTTRMTIAASPCRASGLPAIIDKRAASRLKCSLFDGLSR
jgi:hypothetical protein